MLDAKDLALDEGSATIRLEDPELEQSMILHELDIKADLVVDEKNPPRAPRSAKHSSSNLLSRSNYTRTTIGKTVLCTESSRAPHQPVC